MQKRLFYIILSIISVIQTSAQDTLWIKSDNRFEANKYYAYPNSKIDSINFYSNRMLSHISNLPSPRTQYYNLLLGTDFTGTMMLSNPGRILYQPSTYAGTDYMDNNSQWSFERSMESEHFVIFWEKSFGSDPTQAANGYKFNPQQVLDNAENFWKKYVELGFLIPGKSSTDKYKIEIYAFYQTQWRAEGSGVDLKIGMLNVNPQAINSRNNLTIAHEIGHTFQYLVSCDLTTLHGFNYGYGDNASGGNGWWESCANWQAYKCDPSMQFTDGENFEAHLSLHHLNLLHENWRYQNCFIQDYWCMKHGKDFIGRLWRESTKPEDPVEAYKRMNNLNQEQFCDEQFEGYARMATWDIDGVRDLAKDRIGQHLTYLYKNSAGEWQSDSAHCIQNYGYSIINLNVPKAGITVKADFTGIAGSKGYRSINPDKAGWRYSLVAYTFDGQRVYGDAGKDPSGQVTLTVPANCKNLFFVVMGAPKEHWHHAWDDNASNDEQWPYTVKFTNTNLYGQFDDYPADYTLCDTTVTINAELAYSSSSYTSTVVRYDISAVSRALGLSTAQLKSITAESTANPRFVGITNDGSVYAQTTTSTSDATKFGHWFNISGGICGYGNSAGIFAEYYPAEMICRVGQYPGRLTPGKTYTIRQGFQYKKNAKWYTAKMIVNLTIK